MCVCVRACVRACVTSLLVSGFEVVIVDCRVDVSFVTQKLNRLDSLCERGRRVSEGGREGAREGGRESRDLTVM